MSEAVIAFLMALQVPSPAACDAAVEAWVFCEAEIPPLPEYLGPAVERFQTKHELWVWSNRPVWTTTTVAFEIGWCRANLVDYPSLVELDRLPTLEELHRADAMLGGVDCWLGCFAQVASPMDGPNIAAAKDEICRRRAIVAVMCNARSPSTNLIYRRRALDEVRSLVGARVWLTEEWPINVP